MRTSPSTTEVRPHRPTSTAPLRPIFVADEQLILMLLGEGQNVAELSRGTGWPVRQIHLLGSRHGFLFAADGVPYQPPASGEQPARATRRTERWAS
jgi:hypothetical protein